MAKIIKSVPHKHEFVLADGRRLKNLKELALALSDMADDVFKHHVNDTRNDFASWIGDVYKEKDLAEKLRTAIDKVEAQLTILKHIVSRI